MQPRNGRRGAAIIEASLTLMLFLIFWFSLFDFGFVLYFHQTLMHQARTAARYGVVIDTSVPANLTQVQNVFLFNDPSNAAGLTNGVLGMNSSNVSVTVQPAALGQPVPRLVVKVHGYQYPLITPTVAGLHNGKDIVASLPMEYQ